MNKHKSVSITVTSWKL